MATFRNRHGKWQARVARKGIKPISKSFQNKHRWGNHSNLALAKYTLQPSRMKQNRHRCREMMRH